MKMPPKVIKHGGSGIAYANYGCRCAECTEAHRIRLAKRQAERAAEAKDPNDPRHGNDSFYINHGCRCEPCKKAHSEKCAEYQQKRKAKA